MKKIILLFIILVLNCSFSYSAGTIYNTDTDVITSGLLSKIPGVNFATTKIYEKMIQIQLNKELDAKFSVNLDIFNFDMLKQGIFKSVKVSAPHISYKGLSLSELTAYTLNDKNRIIYKDKKIYYPEEMPFYFEGKIGNDDIQNILSSDIFLKKLNAVNEKYSMFFEINVPAVEINSGRIYFDIPVSTIFRKKPVRIKLNSDVYVENNEIVLKNIAFSSKGNIIDINKFDKIAENLNPLKFKQGSLKSSFCNINIKSAKIEDDKINILGELFINANYGSLNE